MQKLKVNDLVIINTGKDKLKKGKIKSINFKKNRVLVDGINMCKKSIKPSQQNQAGGFVDVERPIHISNVSLIDPVTSKPTRVSFKILDTKKTRLSSKSKVELS